MKMNKFRNNLHPAFFDTPESMEQPRTPEVSDVYRTEVDDLWEKAGRELPIDATTCFDPVIRGEIANYTDSYTYNSDKQNFQLRCKQPNSTKSTKERKKTLQDKEKYIKNTSENVPGTIGYEWDNALKAGFGRLFTAIKEKGRYREPGEATVQEGIRKRTVDELVIEYRNEITQQLRDKVRHTSDKRFDAIKHRLFTEESGVDYPANKIFCKLTGAKSIFNTEDRVVRGISTSTVDELNGESSHEGNVDISERQQRNFLSDDVPNFLWNIRNTPGILKTLSRLPIFSFSENRQSEIDKQAINDFLKVAPRIKGTNGDSAIALFNFISGHDVLMNDGPDEYKKKLKEKGMSIDDKYLDDLVNVGYFFKRTQNGKNTGANQHAIYLSVLQIINEKKGVKGAVAYLKPLVDKYEENKAKEKAGGYKSGETLDRIIGNGSAEIKVGSGETQKYYKEYKELAEKLGISNLESVTRLAGLKMKQSTIVEGQKDYFAKNDEITILANLNNDSNINASDVVDGGTNTGLQFIDISKRIGKVNVLKNLINRAKLENQVLGLGLKDEEINQESIKQGNIKVILLLQNIISKPGEDLFDLLSGRDVVAVQKEASEDGKLREQANEVAKRFWKKKEELINEIYGNKDSKDVDNVTNIEDLQASLAMCLYDTYRLGIGAGATLSLDELAEGLEINAGLQVRDNKTAMLGLSISYERTVNLGKGWTLTPALSAGAFLPILSGNKDFLASTGLSVDLQKKKVNLDKYKVTHHGFKAGVNFVPTMGVVIYGGYHHNYDKREGAETFAEYESFKIEKLLNEVLEDKKDTLKLASLKEEIHTKIARTSIKNKEKAETDILRILEKYEGVTLSDDVKHGIILGVKKQYEKIRFESYKSSLVDTSHVGGRSAGAFLGVGGEMPVGVYGTTDTNTYYNEGYTGETGKAHRGLEGEQEYDQEINQEIIDNLNNSLGLRQEDKKLKLEKEKNDKVLGIFIPEATTRIVKLSDDMKGKAISTNGGILVSQRATMHADVINNGGVQSSELYIGQGPKFEVYLDSVAKNTERVPTNVNITQIDSEILKKRNAEMLNGEDFKAKLKEAGVPEGLILQKVIIKIKEQLEDDSTDKKLKIVITKKANNVVDVDVQEQEELGSYVEILYSEERLLFDEKAKDIADSVYEWAATLDDPYYLRQVKHDKNSEIYKKYAAFDNGLQSGNYAEAKTNLEDIISFLNEKYQNKNLDINLDEVSGDALVQLLMSIHNVFARARDVRGAGKEDALNKYEFKRGANPEKMGDIIARRENHSTGIWNTIHTHEFEGRESNKVGPAYEALIDAIKNYREDDGYFDNTEAVAKGLNNTVGCNLGDKDNPERLLLNPEVYNKVIDLSELDGDVFTSEMRALLHERMMRNFVENPALSAAIRQTVDEVGEIRIKDFSLSGNRGILKLDIGKKKDITLSADMKLGFFTQCVNHTLILDDISITENGKETPFGSDTFKGTEYKSGKVAQGVGKSVFGMGVAITVSKPTNEADNNSEAASFDGTGGGKQYNSNDGKKPDEKTVDPANPGQGGVSGDIR